MAFWGQLGSALLQVGTQFGTAYAANEISRKRNKQAARAAVQSGRATAAPSNGNPPVFKTPRGTVSSKSPVPLTFNMHAQIHQQGLVPGYSRKRRRTNFTNFKALSRALRRVEGFQRAVKRAEKITRKLAPPRRRSAPAHTHALSHSHR